MTAIAEPTPASYPHPAARYFAATRPPFLTATLVACMLGISSAHHAGIALNLTFATITGALALLVHAATNVLNDYFDALNGTDAANNERVFPFTGGSRFIQNGILTPGQTAYFGYSLLATAMLGGIWLVFRTGPGLLFIGAAGLFIGWAYSAAPFRLNSRGVGEFCVLAGFLGVVVGADFVQRGHLDVAPMLIGLPYALLVTNLLYINQFPDRKADAAAGKRHWVVRLPLPLAIKIYPALTALAFISLLLIQRQGVVPITAMLSVLPLLLSLRATGLLGRHAAEPTTLGPAIQLTIAAMLLHGILLSALLMVT